MCEHEHQLLINRFVYLRRNEHPSFALNRFKIYYKICLVTDHKFSGYFDNFDRHKQTFIFFTSLFPCQIFFLFFPPVSQQKIAIGISFSSRKKIIFQLNTQSKNCFEKKNNWGTIPTILLNRRKRLKWATTE